VHRDFAPVWGIDADLEFVPPGTRPPPGTWWLAILDNSDQAGALGYHDLTSQGLPLGKVFAQSDIESGNNWTVTASHELLEMLADPGINLAAFVERVGQDGIHAGILFAYEACDACEADQYGYQIGGTTVSDFVFPSWFEPFWRPGTTQFDYKNQIKQPFELLPGGYIGVNGLSAGVGWQQLTEQPAHAAPQRVRPRVGSRRERRRTARSEWKPSTAHPGLPEVSASASPLRRRP